MKTIIIYATKYGSTAHAAKKLESELNQDVTLVNIMKEVVPPLVDYECVIIGGSIYIGKIQKKIEKYVKKQQTLLLHKKVGLFVCAGSPNKSDREKELRESFPKRIYEHATCKKLFGYVIDYDKMKWLDSMIMRVVSKSNKSVFKLNDDAIKQFAIGMKR